MKKILSQRTQIRSGLIKFLGGLAAGALAASASAFPVITDVVETGGDNEATDTVTAKWTGVTFQNGVSGEYLDPYTVSNFVEDVRSHTDRNHQWNGVSAARPIPGYLLGGEYIMIGNDNRDNAGIQLQVTVSSSAYVYLLIDNRVGDSDGATPPTFTTLMTWLARDGWAAYSTGHNRTGDASRPDEVAFDESGDGVGPGNALNQYASIYRKVVPAGTFTVYEQNGGGLNMYGVVVKVALPPNTPENIVAESGDARIILRWPATGGANGYVVKRSEVAGGPYTIMATNAAASFVDTQVINDLTYYYVISAINDVGESANSAEMVATPKAAPANVTATGSINQVAVRWDAFNGASAYTVSRANVSGGPYTPVATSVSGTEYLDADVLPARNYYYVVTADLAGGGQSGQSAEVVGLTVPEAPYNVSASLFSVTAIKVAWASTNPVVSEFVVEKSTDGVTFSPLTTVTNTARYYVDSGLPFGTPAWYRVQVANASGSSAYSLVVSNATPFTGYNVNFANATNGQPVNDMAPTPAGFAQDIGEVFGDRGNGLSYGWDIDITADGRWRKSGNSPDLRYDTFNHLQKVMPGRTWEIAIPNGFYYVRVVAGDATAVDSLFQFNIEGFQTIARAPSTGNNWIQFEQTVGVADDRLTISSGTVATNNKVAFVDIYPAYPAMAEFTTQPQDQTLVQNRPLTLSVTLTNGPVPLEHQFYGIGQVNYMWYRDDVLLPEYTNATLSIPLTSTADSGRYYVVVSSYAGVITSETAVVTVDQDLAGPQIIDVGSLDGYQISLLFDEMVTDAAIDNFSYTINGAYLVTNVALRPDKRSVILALTSETGELPLTTFTVGASVLDLAGNPSVPDEVPGQAFGFTSFDVGGPIEATKQFVLSNRIEITASGTDIWNATDSMNLAYKELAGDFDVKVRLESLVRRDPWTKAGLMVREELAADSRHTSVIATPAAADGGQNVYQSITRPVKNTASVEVVPNLRPGPVTYPNTWLRLQRQGNSIISYYGTDGVNWTAFTTNTPSPAYPETLYVGLATTAHNNTAGQATTAVYRDLAFGTTPVEPPTLPVPAIASGNLNIAVPTAAGVTYTVEYKNALTDPEWTPLQTITGDGSLQTVADVLTASPTRFYRVRAVK